MGKTFCEKHVCICGLFTILLICACGYLFYAGWWLPIAINTHRLRHNQLVDFEIYSMSTSDWYKYSMGSERISILTYRQQQEYNYKFLLGSFQPKNFSLDDLELIIDDNASSIGNMSGLIPITWDSFSSFVDNELDSDTSSATITDQLFITMYSSNKCVDDDNNTDIYDCWEEWLDFYNLSDQELPKYYIYTQVNGTFIDVNSIHASDV